jgi:phospholipase/carboxylesterase
MAAKLAFEHRWVPAGEAPEQRRTLLLLHGTGGDENDLIPLGQALDPTANLLSPRGRVDEHGSNRFFRRIAEGVFDLENMRQETEALADFLRSAASSYGFDPEQVYAAGFSNGANIGASLLLTHPELLRGAILIRAMVPFEPSVPPALAGTRVLISSGEFDQMVPRANAERLASILVQGGADVEHLWVPVGHNLTRQEIERAKVWLSDPGR